MLFRSSSSYHEEDRDIQTSRPGTSTWYLDWYQVLYVDIVVSTKVQVVSYVQVVQKPMPSLARRRVCMTYKYDKCDHRPPQLNERPLVIVPFVVHNGCE